jgi:Rrf2 family protein
MRISTKGHYGMHAMMDLGARYGEGAVLLRDLCGAHGYSEKYLEQLLRTLRQAGLVESVRGARGGYWLAKPPEKIMVLEILEALEGNFHQLPSKCKVDCPKHDHCAMLETWWEVTERMREKLGGITLGDLLKKQKELDKEKASGDYSI